MTTEIKPIETQYAGCRFRSRLEARWAVFFDYLNIKWEYEAQGYEVYGRPYLPDFELPDLHALVEVKGDPEKLDPHLLAGAVDNSNSSGFGIILGRIPTYEAGKIPCHWVLFPSFLSSLNKRVVYGEYGKPSWDDYDRYWAATSAHDDLREIGDRVRNYEMRRDFMAQRCAFIRCNNANPYIPVPTELPICFPSNDALLNPRSAWHVLPDPKLKAAYEAARSARFEHGEKP